MAQVNLEIVLSVNLNIPRNAPDAARHGSAAPAPGTAHRNVTGTAVDVDVVCPRVVRQFHVNVAGGRAAVDERQRAREAQV